MVPFPPLAEFIPHEHELLAGQREHVAIKQSQVGALFPLIPRHPGEERFPAQLGVVVRERQEVVLAEGVVHPEDEFGVAFRPLGWLQGHVLPERVVDPAEVPLVVEAESAASRRAV